MTDQVLDPLIPPNISRQKEAASVYASFIALPVDTRAVPVALSEPVMTVSLKDPN